MNIWVLKKFDMNGHNTSIYKHIVGFFIILLLLGAYLNGVNASSTANFTLKSVIIKEGDFSNRAAYGLSKDDQVVVKVTASSPIDVYILSLDQNNEFYINQRGPTFTPFVSQLNTSKAELHFTIPDDQTYVVVVDNDYRNVAGEAIPTTNVTADISLQVTNSPSDNAFWGGCFVLIFIGVILIIAIIVVVIIVIRRKKVRPQPYQPIQPQSYPQSQYSGSLPQQYSPPPSPPSQYPQQPQQYSQQPPQSPPPQT